MADLKTVTNSASDAAKPPAPSSGREFFRQTRHSNDTGQLSLVLAGKVVELRNWSRTGLSFRTRAESFPCAINGEVSGVAIFCGRIQIYDGKVQVRSLTFDQNGDVLVGAAFMDNLFLVEGVHAAVVVNECSDEVTAIKEEISDASAACCQILLILSTALRRIEKACEAEELRWRNLSYDQRAEAEKIFLPHMSNAIRTFLVEIDVKIGKVIDVESLGEDSIYHRLVNEYIYPYFEKADLARRAFEKPRGYAGDYEMMNQIYRGSFEGANLFGRVLHNYITNEHSGESVKFRKPYLHQHLMEQLRHPGERRALAVAAGPAVEYQEALLNWQAADIERLHMTLFDLDREALEHAQSRIMEISSHRGVSPQVAYVNASVKGFLTARNHDERHFDLIYSAGLFDYLDNLTSAALIRRFYEMLNPGGTLVVGNFVKENLTKAFLHLITKWTLIHKNKEEISSWTMGLENCRKRVEFDKNNMIAFLVVEKNAVD